MIHFVACFTSYIMSVSVSRKLRRASNTLAQATQGVGSVNFWPCNVAWTRGGGVLRFYGLFRSVHLGMAHQCLTTNRCHGADTVPAWCSNTLAVPMPCTICLLL